LLKNIGLLPRAFGEPLVRRAGFSKPQRGGG
jgi:hypothetical protein